MLGLEPVKTLLRRFVTLTPVVIAGLSSPMPPNGSSPGSGLGSSRSRSRSLISGLLRMMKRSSQMIQMIHFILDEEGLPLKLRANTRERVKIFG